MKTIKNFNDEMTTNERIDFALEFTRVYKKYSNDLAKREAKCFSLIYPKLFVAPKENDVFVGRANGILPNGSGCEGYVTLYGNIEVLTQIKKEGIRTKEVEELINYWNEENLLTEVKRDLCEYPVFGHFDNFTESSIVEARYAGSMLDYSMIIDNGIGKLKEKIELNRIDDSFTDSALSMLDTLSNTIECYYKYALETNNHVQAAMLEGIIKGAPTTFKQGFQLMWLYAVMSVSGNYSRMDDFLGDLLVNDLKEGRLTSETALSAMKDIFNFIADRDNQANNRVIIGGQGRRNPKNADVFARIAINAMKTLGRNQPQLSLRFDNETPKDIKDSALECIALGTTFPMLYNDDVNVPAVMKAMNVTKEESQTCVPLGCGEYVLGGLGVGTPSVCTNPLKMLTMFLNDGVDRFDYVKRMGLDMKVKNLDDYLTYEMFKKDFYLVLDYHLTKTAKKQMKSYQMMNKRMPFVFNSLLTHGCIEENKGVFEAKSVHLGGCNEIYGQINTGDSLAAIKKLVFVDKKYKLSFLAKAINNNFEGYELVQKDCLNAPKYGNDDDFADLVQTDLHDFISTTTRDAGMKAGLDSYGIVLINNSTNTVWGRTTASSADGRSNFTSMAPGNNPQSGMDQSGPTAMLNSLVKLKVDNHYGTVQNFKLGKSNFKGETSIAKILLDTYFENGGSQLMVSVIDNKILKDAVKNPSLHRNVIVRVGGYSAIFVNEDPDVQQEIIARTLH